MHKVSEYQSQVATVRPDTPIWEIADEMDAQSVGSVVVLGDEGRPVGIVTDRDLVIRVLAAGRDEDKTTAADVMSRELLTCELHQDMNEVTELMRSKGVRRVPVLRDGEMIGIVALDDVVAGLNSSLWNITDAVRIETRESRRSAWRRRRREQMDESLEDLRSQLADVGKETADYLVREVSELLKRLRGRRD